MAAKRRALAERRRAVGHTQEKLAELLGVERSTVVRWEAGDTKPQPWCRPKLAKALAVPIDQLQKLLTDLQDLPARPDDIIFPSSEECLPIEIGALVGRFSAMDIASRRLVLQELTIMSGAVLLQPVHRWLAQELTVVPFVSPSEPVGSGALDALERAVTLFRRWDFSGMGGLRRKAVVDSSTRWLKRCTNRIARRCADDYSTLPLS
ncbi:MAG: helix-turn-helix transcriptional regulator [Burkholderiales bacterium]